jgi:Bifunctional DNA primase/polymerase, N-terminal
MSSMLAKALRYAAAGWPVFPCQPDGKVPFPRTNGVKDATTDPEVITGWWTRCPAANVAIATGDPAPTWWTSTSRRAPLAAPPTSCCAMPACCAAATPP